MALTHHSVSRWALPENPNLGGSRPEPCRRNVLIFPSCFLCPLDCIIFNLKLGSAGRFVCYRNPDAPNQLNGMESIRHGIVVV